MSAAGVEEAAVESAAAAFETPRRAEAWRKVTDAVHEAGGRIFVQLAHSGAVSHPDFFDGALPMAPSVVNPGLISFTPSGFKPTVVPRAITLYEIKTTVEDHASAARNARLAGFDGVEIHVGTTYLLPEFQNSTSSSPASASGRAHPSFPVCPSVSS